MACEKRRHIVIFFQEPPYNKIRCHKLLDKLSVFIQKLLFIRQYRDVDYFGKGPNWWSITHSLASAIVKEEKQILTRFRYVLCCDEIFLQTYIKHHPEFMSRLYRPEDEYLSCMRYIDWTRGTPYVFRSNDFGELIHAKGFFARKFEDLDIYTSLYEWRESRL